MPNVNERTSSIAQGMVIGWSGFYVAAVVVKALVDGWPTAAGISALLFGVSAILLAIVSLSAPSRERPRARGECGVTTKLEPSRRRVACSLEAGHKGLHRSGAVFFDANYYGRDG